MTIKIVDSTADYSSHGAGYYFGSPWPEFSTAGEPALEGAWFFGTDFPLPDGQDYSRNGRHCEIIGAPTVNAHGSICNVSNCYQAPMSLDDLIEMGGDSSYSLMVIAAIAVTPAAGMLIGCFGNNGRGAIGYEATKQGGMYGTSSTGFAATVAGARSTANQMFGSSHDVNNGHFYLQRTGAALQTASVAVPAAPRVPFSSDMIRIGGSLAASGWASNHTIIGGAAFSRDLTQDEHEEAMAALVPWLADFGVVL